MKKQKIVIVLLGISMALIAFLLDKKSASGTTAKENLHSLPFLHSMGDPVKDIAILKDVISIIKERDGAYPIYNKIKLSVQYDDMPNCLFYSYNSNGYQVAIWSGETTWIYNSANDSYYEFNQDVISSSWYDPESNSFYNEKDAKEKCGLKYSIHPVD